MPGPRIAGSSVSAASSTKLTDSIMPAAIERNAGIGTSRTAERLISTVRPLNSTALPAVSIVTPTAPLTSSGRRVQRSAEARDDEQRVVDAQREREHHREVEGPDRKVGDARDAVEHAHRDDEAGRR